MKAHVCCPYNENKIIPGGYIFYDINFNAHENLTYVPNYGQNSKHKDIRNFQVYVELTLHNTIEF